ncbi:helix-turn-helix domain-containing protein [Rhodobacterales bacterium HKCCE3408]|nr:helix-turn-helix domain-containing protein [Rhodobacterales bacterium HKCCE3408]
MIQTSVIRPAALDRCADCPGKCFGPCAVMTAEIGQKVAQRSAAARYTRGAELLAQGEPVTRIGIVTSGLIKIAMVDEHGNDRVLQLLHAGEIVGTPAGGDSDFSYQAATDAEICWIALPALDTILQEEPAAYRGFLDTVLGQLREQHLSTVAMRGRNTLERVAYWLVLQMPRNRPEGAAHVRILLSRRDLASLLDMTVETLCRVLHQLDETGALTILSPEEVLVTDLPHLRALARDHDEAIRAALSRDGWEWGARIRDVAAPVRLRAGGSASPRLAGHGIESGRRRAG